VTDFGLAPSDSLREVYERRGGEEYAVPVLPDPALDRKFAVLTEEIRGLLPADAYLDAGCGDGRFLAALPSLGPVPARVVGVDIADSILATARLAVAQVGVEAELVRGNLERLPLHDAEFDLVVSIQVLEHLLDPAAGLRELARVLRPGGTLLLSTDNRRRLLTKALNAPRWFVAGLVRRRNSRVRIAFPHADFTRRRLVALLEDAGLVVERTRTFRFSIVGASPRLRRYLNRVDARLPDVGLGDILVAVARRPADAVPKTDIR
jgi:2-polyprenyl-3-methyl-5-hydroxy-6-metoxy-1,4-benzoquinol methylase